MNIARFAFRNGRGILLLALFLSVLGLFAARRMPESILPDFPFPRLVIIAGAGDLAIPEMVLRVTRPLEGAAAGVPGAKLVRSKTARGSLELSVDFDWGTNMFEAFTRLNANVAALRSSLPAGSSVQVEWVNPSSFPVIGYSITSDTQSPRDLLDVANLSLAPYLSRLPGVYRVNVQGGEAREYQVVLNPDALSAAGITPDQVSTALSEANVVQSVGRFTRQYQGYQVLVDSRVKSSDDILNTVLLSRNGKPLRVRDVATVREGEEVREQLTTANGHEAVLLNILKQPGASTTQISDGVKAALKELQPSLPPGVRIQAFYDESDLLRDGLGSLRDSILIGALLAFIVLLLFLRSWRSTLVVLLCLPITALIAFMGLQLCGQTINLMTLGGLAVGLGLIIDDVVVTLENIYRHAEMGKEPRQAAIEGAAEIQKPMIGSSLTTIAVFLPLAFLSEITGAMFAPIAITLTLLLVISVILAVTVVPLITARLLGRIRPHAAPETAGKGGKVGRLYERTIRTALDYPLPLLAAALGLTLLAVVTVPTLPTGLLPEMDEGAFTVDYMLPGGAPLALTDQQVRVIENEVIKTPEVQAYSRRTGAEMGFFVTEPNRGDFMVKLKPLGQRKRSSKEIREDLEERVGKLLPGVTVETVNPIADRIADIAGEPTPIEVKIFGDDPKKLKELSEQVNHIVETTKGTAESVHGAALTGPELGIHVDSRRAGLLGITPADVARSLEAGMEGRSDTQVVNGERVIGVRVMYPPSLHRTLDQIRDLQVLSKNGKRVPLSAIAEFTEVPGVYEVMRENQKPVAMVAAGLNGRDLGSANREVQARVAREVKLPPGYTLQYGGLWATQQASFESLLAVFALGLFLVYLVTLFQYNRFEQPTALVLAAAFALVGVVGALKLTGTVLNASSFTGAIMIFGMVLTNGIVLMDTIRDHESAGLPLPDAIMAAGRQRLRPVLMTATIAVLALLPLLFGVGAGAQMQQPLAVSVIGGLVVSPFFTLLLAPVLLHLFRRGR